MPMSTQFHRLGAVGAAFFCAAVQAQLVDDAELRRVGNDAVLVVRFVTPVQYLRTSTTRSGDVAQIYYDILPTPDTLSLITSERRIPPGARTPVVTLTDEAIGPAVRNRRLVLRFSANTPLEARPGLGNRSIEIVLRGKGAAVTALTPPAPAGAQAVRGGPFSIVLRRASSAGAAGDTRVPKQLQDYVVSVRPRVVDGKTVYETVVSGIATRQEAQALIDQLRPAFPQAMLEEPAAAPPAAQAPGPAPAAPAGPVEPRAAELMAQARQAMERGEYAQAISRLDDVLAMPPNSASQEAQEMIAFARWREGDPERARTEFELYLRRYPDGPGAARAREALQTLAPAAPVAAPGVQEAGKPPPVTTTLSGSLSTFYYGGQSKIRTQEFLDSPLGGLPQLVSDASLSATDQKQLVTNVDLNWRRKDADTDLRMVLRDTHTLDLMRSDRTHNRLTAAYVDYRSQSTGLSVRAGRQSPLGAGVMGRFDGVQVGYQLAPRWRINAVAGQPTDTLLDSRRFFYGASVDVDSLTRSLGGSLYVIEQRIDGETDRRAVGTELRFQNGGLSATGLLDYDVVLRGLNIASLQGTWQWQDNTVVNMLYDRRATPLLMLGNGLFLQNPVLGIQARRLQDLLAAQSLSTLRQQVRDTTAYTTQAMLGATRPITPNWQVGADVRLTNIGELLPVPDILPNGQPGTGNIWSLGGQVIGTNLYSSRDTHVLVLNLLKAPTYRGTLLSYNNSSSLSDAWLLEPALRFYQQRDDSGVHTRRWSPGMRVTYRPTPKLAIESEASIEFSNVSGPNRTESSHRTFYYIGLRYEL